MVFKINGNVVDVLNAPLISETLDETLDSGSMVLAFSDIENAIAPMSVVSITDDKNNVLSFLVSSDIVSIGSKDPMKYVHNLTIIQNTRKFAKTQVRNTVFSQPAKPILTAYSNGLFYDTTTQATMTRPLGLSSIANKCEVSIKSKIKRAFISFKIVEIENKTTNQMPKLTSTINRITFNVYKGASSIVAVNLTNVNSDTIYELPLTNFNGGIDYSIGNVVVYSSVTPTGNYFAVNVKLNIETYIYTLFDVLETLNNQIALDEYEEDSEVYAPSINVTYTYVPSSSGYECSFKITNPNTFEVTINYSTTGSWVKSGTLTIPARGTSASIVLGTGNSGEQGTISAYATYNGINSETTNVNYALSTQLQPPVLSWADDSLYGSRAILTNNNNVNVRAFYKFYVQGATSDFSFLDLTAYGGHEYASGWFNNKHVYYEYYCQNMDTGEESRHVTGDKIIGTLPVMTDPVLSTPVVTTSDTTYVITTRITNNNAFDVKCFVKSNNTEYTEYSILANSYVDAVKNELITSGSNGTISVYFTKDNYDNSNTIYATWNADLTAPTVNVFNITTDGTYYTISGSIVNNNTRATVAWAWNNNDTPVNIGTVSAGSSINYSITTSVSGGNSGTIFAYLKSTDGNSKSPNGSHSWTLSSISVAISTYISNNGESGEYAFETTRNLSVYLDDNGNITLQNCYNALINYDQNYQSYSLNSSSSSVSTANRTASIYLYAVVTPTETLTKPTISVYSNSTSQVAFKITNSNSTIVSFKGSYTDSSGTYDVLVSDIPANGNSIKYISYGSEVSSISITGYFASVGYYDSATASQSANKPTNTLTAPNIDVISNSYTSVTIRVFNPNSVNCSFSGTYKGDDNVSHTISDSLISYNYGYKDHTITWGSGISYLDFSGYLSSDQYTSSSNGTASATRPSQSALSDPTISYSDTIVDNGDGTYTKTSKVYATNTNAVAVSYSAVVNGVSSSGNISAYTGGTEKFALIGTYQITSAGSDSFDVTCSFSASGYTGSSVSTSHSL